MPEKFLDIKAEVRRIATENGVDADKALAIAEKCYAEIPMWRPYGGATSFEAIDAQKSASAYTQAVEEETYALRAIVENIIESDEIGDAQAKASAISAAAAAYPTRVNALKLGQEQKTISLWDRFKNLLSPAEKEVADQIQINVMGMDLKRGERFKVFTDNEGKPRWISASANAFQDREKEIFTTKALEEAIEYGDKSNERGPLLVFHVKSAVIGQCDYQALAGRFLIESGTFDDTPLGQKALEYFRTTDEEHQVSIGYKYVLGDEQDGQYDWLRIRERSVCPAGTAANTWTDFKVIGDMDMNATKVATLEKMFGADLAKTVISQAEEATKTLEEAGVAYKTLPGAEEHVAELYKTVKEMPDGDIKKTLTEQLVKMNGGKSLEPEADGKKEEAVAETPAAPAVTPEFQTELAGTLASLITSVETLNSALGTLQSEVKELKMTDDEKVANQLTPRGNVSTITRPSESEETVVTDQKILENLSFKTTGEDPAQKYVNDLLGIKS